MQCPRCHYYIPDPTVDYLVNVPVDQEFDKYHSDPIGYGDEDDWLLVSRNNNTRAEALAKIQKMMRDDWGLDEACIPKDENDLQIFDVGWAQDPDSSSNGTYWIVRGENNHLTPRWQAWGVATQ